MRTGAEVVGGGGAQGEERRGKGGKGRGWRAYGVDWGGREVVMSSACWNISVQFFLSINRRAGNVTTVFASQPRPRRARETAKQQHRYATYASTP